MLNKYEYDFLINEEINNVINSIMISEEPNSLRIINDESNFLTENLKPTLNGFYIVSDFYTDSAEYKWSDFPNEEKTFKSDFFKDLMRFKGLSSLFVYYLCDDHTFGFEGARRKIGEDPAISIARAVPYHMGSESWYDSQHFFYILFDGNNLSLQNSRNPEKYSSEPPSRDKNFLKCLLRISNHATKHQLYAASNNDVNCVLNIMLHSDGAPENRDANQRAVPFSPAGMGKSLVSIEAFYDIGAEVFGKENLKEKLTNTPEDYYNKLCDILCQEDKPEHAQINNLAKFQNIKNFVTDLRNGNQPTITIDWIKENIDPNPSIIVSTNDQLRAVIQSSDDKRKWKTALYGTKHTFTNGHIIRIEKSSNLVIDDGSKQIELSFPNQAFCTSGIKMPSRLIIPKSRFPSKSQSSAPDIENLEISDFPISNATKIEFQYGETTFQLDLSTLVLNKKNSNKLYKGFLPENVDIEIVDVFINCYKKKYNKNNCDINNCEKIQGVLGYYKSIPFFCDINNDKFYRITSRDAISHVAEAYLQKKESIDIILKDIEGTPTFPSDNNTSNDIESTTTIPSDGIESTPTNTMSENRINRIITESINKFIMKFCLLK